MRPITVAATMANAALDEVVAPHAPIEHWSWRCSADPAAIPAPMEIRKLLENHRTDLTIVPVSAYRYCCSGGYGGHRACLAFGFSGFIHGCFHTSREAHSICLP